MPNLSASGTRVRQQEFHRTAFPCCIIQPKPDASTCGRCQLCCSKCAAPTITNPRSRWCPQTYWFRCTSREAEGSPRQKGQEASNDSKGEESTIGMLVGFAVIMM